MLENIGTKGVPKIYHCNCIDVGTEQEFEYLVKNILITSSVESGAMYCVAMAAYLISVRVTPSELTSDTAAVSFIHPRIPIKYIPNSKVLTRHIFSSEHFLVS